VSTKRLGNREEDTSLVTGQTGEHLIFSMIVVDSFLLYQEFMGGKTKQLEYYQALLLALIDNCYENGVVLQQSAENRGAMHHSKQGWRGL
jgi:hypothetical protein